MTRRAALTLAALFAALAWSPASFADTDYLVITTKPLAEVGQSFASYRKSRGRQVKVTLIDELYNAQTPTKQRVQTIQRYVRQVWKGAGRPQPFFLLIVGDVPVASTNPQAMDRIPCGYVLDDSEQTAQVGRKDKTISTDNVYALMDDRDVIPDIAVGRISVKSTAEGLAALNKVKTYESGVNWGPWRRKLTFFASQGGFGIADRLIEWQFTRMADKYIPYDFDLSMTYANPSSPYVYLPDRFSDKVIERANKGSLILNYIGHGQARTLDTLRWGGRRYPILNFRQLSRIQVQGRTPVFFVVACFTGRYDLANDQDCIAERLLKSPGGPAAIIGSSRISHPYPNAVFQKDFLDQVCRRRTATLGEAVRLAKVGMCKNFDRPRRQLEIMALFLVPKPERERLYKTHCAMYNLFGDPALELKLPRAAALKLDKDRRPVVAGDALGASGQALLSVECERSTILRPVLGTLPRDLKDPDNRQRVQQSYQHANNKIVRRWRVRVEDGRLILPEALDLSLPRIAGRYYLKLYAWGAGWDAAGSTELGEVAKQKGPRRWLPAQNRVEKKNRERKAPQRRKFF